MIRDISDIFQSKNSTRESFALQLNANKFKSLALTGTIDVEVELIRVDDGIVAIFKQIEATQEDKCVRCGKTLKNPLLFDGGEWLFYDKPPRVFDDENELMLIDRNKMTINLKKALRQEIQLNLKFNPSCDAICKEFEEPDVRVKSLSGLKDMWDDSE